MQGDGKKDTREKGRREKLMKHLFPGCPRSSNEEAVDELCQAEESSEDVSTLSHGLHTIDICSLFGQSGHTSELRYCCIICSGSD
jgi:hypothetical protein